MHLFCNLNSFIADCWKSPFLVHHHAEIDNLYLIISSFPSIILDIIIPINSWKLKSLLSVIPFCISSQVVSFVSPLHIKSAFFSILKLELGMNHSKDIYSSLFVVHHHANPCKHKFCRCFCTPYDFPCVMSFHGALWVLMREKQGKVTVTQYNTWWSSQLLRCFLKSSPLHNHHFWNRIFYLLNQTHIILSTRFIKLFWCIP